MQVLNRIENILTYDTLSIWWISNIHSPGGLWNIYSPGWVCVNTTCRHVIITHICRHTCVIMNIEYITWLSGCAPSGSLSASAPGLARQLQKENFTQLKENNWQKTLHNCPTAANRKLYTIEIKLNTIGQQLQTENFTQLSILTMKGCQTKRLRKRYS